MKQLADKVGVSVLSIQRIETGKISPSVVLLSEIAYQLHHPLIAFISGEQEVLVFKGSERDVIKSGKLTLNVVAHRGEVNEGVSITVGKSGAGQIIDRHKNDGHEFTYVIKGKQILKYGNHEYRLEPGDAVYHNGKDWHSVIALGSSEFLNIHFVKT
jgi:quercetin dioxygenase-like cupin family protein